MQNAPALIGLSLLAAFAFAGPKSADTTAQPDLCNELKQLSVLAAGGFSADPSSGAASSGPKPLPKAQRCAVVQNVEGHKTYHCAWKFPFRAAAALTFSNTYNQTIAACFADATQRVADLGVNHPDSYEQQQHVVEGAVIRVSVKDKGALQETYVFVAIQGQWRRDIPKPYKGMALPRVLTLQ
jgi:hypothetical protein